MFTWSFSRDVTRCLGGALEERALEESALEERALEESMFTRSFSRDV
jgi:hypothetical protein